MTDITKLRGIGSTPTVRIMVLKVRWCLMNATGSEPSCITGVMNWVHGIYQLLDNGSIITTPFGDGFQQIQDPCAAVSNFIEPYNDTELYQSWRIFSDPQDGPKLHLFQFDGSPLAPQFQLSAVPNMLPTQLLRNVTPPQTTTARRSLQKRSAGERAWTPAGVGALALSLATVGAVSILL